MFILKEVADTVGDLEVFEICKPVTEIKFITKLIVNSIAWFYSSAGTEADKRKNP